MAQSNEAPRVVRKGTATRSAGKATAKKILAAARDLLMQEGYAQFSMRNVARSAGLHLANLQYYFPTRSDLVHALLANTRDLYIDAYEQLLEGVTDDPVRRFKIVLKYQLEDIFVAETRQFFVQLWALLSTEESADELLGELYSYDIEALGEIIRAMEPELSAAVIRQRATLLAGTIEGLMIVRGQLGRKDESGEALLDAAYRLGFEIATGKTPAPGKSFSQ